MSNKGALFHQKDDDSEIRIEKNEVEEVIPDADFRFSLITLVDGHKYFVSGTEDEVWEKLREASDKEDGVDLNIIL
jgi:uncharacterized protein YlzI (FlbEa/FlbD family)